MEKNEEKDGLKFSGVGSRELEGGVLGVGPLGFDGLGEFGRGHLVDQDLDAGLELVIAPPVLIVDP